MIISIVAAVARDGAIGRRGDLLFHIPSDMRHFRAVTMGHPVIMGRRTWESLPGGALPGRRNIVVTRQSGYRAENAETATSLEKALELTAGSPEVMIIGGGELYNRAISTADRMYLTEIDASAPDADTYFPEYDDSEWCVADGSEERITDMKSGLNLRFVCKIRIK